MISSHFNVFAVLLAAIINMVVGYLWYSPQLFGKSWAALLGKSMDEMKDSGNTGYLAAGLGALVQSIILAILINSLDITSVIDGAYLGALLWLGFTASTTISDTVFSGRPWKLWQINTGYYLVVLIINGALIAALS